MSDGPLYRYYLTEPDEWADVFKVGVDTFGRTRDFGAALLAMSAA